MWRAPVCAIGFLTRIPMPRVSLSTEDVAQSAGYFAWVGALIAAVLWACSLAFAGLGTNLTALLVVALWASITGALHLDGLADSFDGLSGGRGERARTLEIMRDSRIGAHGATALVIVLGLKWAALARVLELGGVAWLMAPVVARFVCTGLLASFSYARESGLGSAFDKRVGPRELCIGALVFAPAIAWLGSGFVPSALVGAAVALAFAARMRLLLGGLTGDVQGAAVELCETATLLALASPALR